jgi:predicted  nucleic acid-binding Zn-ribbon protein
MKTKMHIKTMTLVAITAGAAWLWTGCGTTKGYKQADKTGEGIAEFRAEVLNGKKAIDATVASLDQIAATATTNPRKAFESYSKNVANLESTAENVRKRGQDMQERGKAYFAQWEKQLAEVKNPEIQRLATERKAKLNEAFDTIRTVAEPLKTKFTPWMSDLKDLQTYLSNDLTVNGIDAAKNLFAKTKTEGMDVQKAMDELVAELNTISATLTPAKAEKK